MRLFRITIFVTVPFDRCIQLCTTQIFATLSSCPLAMCNLDRTLYKPPHF